MFIDRLLFFRFNRLDLGKIPPRIEGVTLFSVDENRIIVDLDTFYEGDLRCVVMHPYSFIQTNLNIEHFQALDISHEDIRWHV